MYASGELCTDNVKMSDVAYHNPELDLPARSREVHELSTRYDRGAHEGCTVGSQFSMVDPITRQRPICIERDREWFWVFVYGGIPLGGVLVQEDGDVTRSIPHGGRMDG